MSLNAYAGLSAARAARALAGGDRIRVPGGARGEALACVSALACVAAALTYAAPGVSVAGLDHHAVPDALRFHVWAFVGIARPHRSFRRACVTYFVVFTYLAPRLAAAGFLQCLVAVCGCFVANGSG